MNTKARWSVCTALGIAVLVSAGCGGPAERKAAYISHGEKYFAQRNYAKARVEFGNALQIDPKDAKAHYLAGQVAEKLGDPRGAVGQYQAAIDLDPKQSTARAALARLFVLGGVPAKALDLVETGLKSDPQNAALLTARAAAKAAQGDVPGAVEDAETANKIGAPDQYTYALLGSLYQRQSQTEKARDIIRAGIERLPNNVDLRVILADLDVQSGQHLDEAEGQIRKTIALEPDVVDHRFVLARYFVANKDFDGAESALRDAIKAFPDNPKAKRALIQLLAEHRGADRAQAQLEAFVKEAPKDNNLKLELADYLQTQGKSDQADAVYHQIIDAAGTDAAGLTARDRLANAALKRGDVAGAQALIAEVLKASPHDASALAARSSIEMAQGDASAAITDLRTVLRDQPSSLPVLRTLARAHLQNHEPALAEEVLQQAVQTNPKDVDARLEWADVLRTNGKLDQARPVLEQMVSEQPEDLRIRESLFRVQAQQNDLAAARRTADLIRLGKPDMALGYFLTGLVDEQEKKLDVAESDYQQALAKQPRGTEPLQALVQLNLGRKQPARALDQLNAIIAKDADNILARSLKGDVLASQGQFDAASQTYQDAIDRAPKQDSLYRGLSLAQLGGKHTDAAIAALSKGIDQNPDSQQLRLDLALLYTSLGRVDDAVNTYEQAIKRFPNSIGAANNLAMLLVARKDDAASLKRAQELADLLSASKDPVVVDTRGWVAYKSGHYSDAVTLLTQAVDRSPQNPEFSYHLGMAQLKAGNTLGAQKSLQLAVDTNRSFPGVDEARKTLAQLKKAG